MGNHISHGEKGTKTNTSSHRNCNLIIQHSSLHYKKNEQLNPQHMEITEGMKTHNTLRALLLLVPKKRQTEEKGSVQKQTKKIIIKCCKEQVGYSQKLKQTTQ